MRKSKKVKPVEDREIKKTQVIFNANTRDYLMRANNCSVGFNMPQALEGENTFGLPPYRKRMPYLVDKFPACPENWMRSEGKVKSYFVPVVEGDGMWLDFNNNESNTHHLAIVVSVQGINPITGLPCNDAQLEQYIEECPKHKIKFGPDRYCKECDYKWPKQNYICTTGTPNGQFWLDGFRAADGLVRQYILTAEKMRGVASNVIGEDRVFAIGISFFLSKEKKPVSTVTYGSRITTGGYNFHQIIGQPDWNYLDKNTSGDFDNTKYAYYSTCDSLGLSDASMSMDIDASNNSNISNGIVNCSSLGSKGAIGAKGITKCGGIMKQAKAKSSIPMGALARSVNVIKTKNLEVGAGAKINQSIYDDPEKLDYWHTEPESIICINYCLEEEVRKIIEAGMVDVEGSKEGFLQDIPVGN